MIGLYNISIFFYRLFIKTASLFNEKAKKWEDGRKNIFQFIEKEIDTTKPKIWFHCASLGEFEQAIPLMKIIKEKKSNYEIVVTFFSPSGYEFVKKRDYFDYKFYLPIDSQKNAKKLIELINPEICFFVKYEFWFHYFNELKKNNSKLYLLSATFRGNQVFFKWYGSFFRKIIQKCDYIFCQNESSKALIKSINNNVLTSGDTRFDRVSESKKTIVEIKNFIQNKTCLILGSSWEKEENILLSYLENNNLDIKIIIAPHNVSYENIKRIEQLFRSYKYTKYSKIDANADILIIDCIGILSSAYQYTDIAFVGGGFTNSLHNILEPASEKNAIIYGNNNSKFWEGKELVKHKGAFEVASYIAFEKALKALLDDQVLLKETQLNAFNFINNNKGATKIVFEKVFE